MSYVSGFGLCNIKSEGAPLHPDDAGIGKSNPLYQVQLKLYTDYFLKAQPGCTQLTIPDKQE